MKKLFTLALAIIIAAQLFANKAPEVSEEKNVLKVNTLSLIFGTGSIFYEHKINDYTSGQLGVAYLNYKFDNAKFSGIILTPEARFYVKKDAIDGFYVGPYFRYQNFQLEDTDTNDNATYNNYGGGFVLGRQWITNSGFTMDLFFGGHYGSGKITSDIDADNWESPPFEGFRTRIGFALGFAF
jgi:hypothetical protein